MILLKLSICFIVILAGIILAHGSESVPKKCPSASTVHKRSTDEDLPKLSRTKRDGCLNLHKLSRYDSRIKSSQNNDTAKINATNPEPSAETKVNRKKREPNPARCDPKYPGSGPCVPPPPQQIFQ